MNNEEIKSLEEKINNLTNIVTTHISRTEVYRENQTKLLDAHSKEIWGNGKPGLDTKVDRLEQAERNRTETEGRRAKVLWGTVTAVIGVIADKLFHFLPR